MKDKTKKILLIIIGLIIFMMGAILGSYVKFYDIFSYESFKDLILDLLSIAVCAFGIEVIWFAIKKHNKNKKK